LNKKISVFQDDVLSFGKINVGARSYIAVSNGIKSEIKLNSRSFYKGITNNFVLTKGLEIPILENVNDLVISNSSIKIDDLHFNALDIACAKGPEFELLSAHQQKLLCENLFSISKDINRMGYRLNETIPNNLSSILTSAVLPGTVQLTPSGALIILMRDCQVTGGYPRVLQILRIGINILAQKTRADKIQFVLK
jgi:allophanate hydrolase subunit 2